MTYPIDLEHLVEGLAAGPNTLHRLLEHVKAALPYNFRYKSSPEFKTCFVTIPHAEMTADAIFRLISEKLLDQWRIVALMGHVIMYDDTRSYPSAWRYYHQSEALEASPDTEPAGDIAEIATDEANAAG